MASVPPRRTQQLLGTAGVVSNAELLSNFVPPLQGETEADYADIIIEVAKELGLVGKGAVTAGGARARLIKYIQNHPRTHVDRDAMWMAVVDQADAQGVQASTPSTLEPWAGDKRVKNISPAFKEVVSKAYTFAAASPDVMETLSQTTLSTLHTSRSNLEPSLSALVLNEAIHDQLAAIRQDPRVGKTRSTRQRRRLGSVVISTSLLGTLPFTLWPHGIRGARN